MSASIRIDALSVTLGGRRVVDDVDLEVPAGSWLCLLGPNGAGKTTLLRAVSGTVRHEGAVAIGDVRSDAATHPRVRARLVGVVPQTPVIPPGMTAFEYVLLGRTPHQGLRVAASLDDRHRTLAVLQRLDLEGFASRDLTTLSGGERQRVVLARALVAETPVLLLDEPTAALDLGHQFEILELLAELQEERGLTVVSTLHDLSIAGQFGDRVAVLAEGRLVATGTPTDVLSAETIGRWWGVEATTDVEPDGRVSITVRRRSPSARVAAEPLALRAAQRSAQTMGQPLAPSTAPSAAPSTVPSAPHPVTEPTAQRTDTPRR